MGKGGVVVERGWVGKWVVGVVVGVGKCAWRPGMDGRWGKGRWEGAPLRAQCN